MEDGWWWRCFVFILEDNTRLSYEIKSSYRRVMEVSIMIGRGNIFAETWLIIGELNELKPIISGPWQPSSTV
ncbi:MAG: hypothetical protein K0S39_6018 [Paenibacillus sp.]|jgi:hypothetical protein|nr:hypothetical protein [Paenibacillus sp.]